MTEQELEEKIKEKIDSIMGKTFKLHDKCGGNLLSNEPLLLALIVIFNKIGIALKRASIQLNGKDILRPNIARIYGIIQQTSFIPWFLPCVITTPHIMSSISKQDAYEFIKQVDNALDIEDKVLDLADQIKKELKND
ncbi:MAG: hypothetical protein IJ099_01455 [Alphaproteobacteria bacterium]|nr:hypothetical protein [Alphaproteobacteria bacterium]